MNNIELVNRFLEISRIEKNLTDRTLKSYRCDLKDAVKYFSQKSILELERDDLREYLSELESRNLRSTSIRRKLATLKVFFSVLEDEKLIQVSPARKLNKKFRTSKRLPRIISSTEIEGLLKSAYRKMNYSSSRTGFGSYKNIRDCLMLEILFVAGLRIDELVKLNIFDLDLNRRTMLISGKGRKERLLYISSDEVIKLIARYMSARSLQNTTSKALLLNRFGNRLSVNSIGHIFKAQLDSAGIPNHYTPHCLRHTMATLLIENGADVRSVQEILGHSSISTTEIYLNVSKRRKQQVLNSFNHRNTLQIA